MIITSFLIFLLIFIFIGISSTIKSKQTNADYLIAGRNIKPWLVALSAVATANSGYMFIGMIGYTYSVGLSSIWLMVGWILGDFLASFSVHEKLRVVSEKEKVLSFAGVLAKWNGTNFKRLRVVAGIFTLLFLGTYAAAQLNAGSKALHVLLGWDYQVGAVIGALMVLAYCFAGGIRASIWTDAAQSVVMICAMLILVLVSISHLGGFKSVLANISNISPTYLNLFPSDSPFGGILGPAAFVLGWLFGGFGVVGQPHIMVRFMAMDKAKHIKRVRIYYYSWYTLFSILTIFCGLLSRLLISDTARFDAELALPTMASNLLPEALVGLILAGLFSATMSTADSQILSCTAAISRDLLPNKKISYVYTKLATVFVTLGALMIALFASSSVFSLVVMAWAALSVTFAPLLFVYAFGGKPNENTAILMMFMGITTMIIWRFLGLSNAVYEVLPGIVLGFTPYFFSKLWKNKKAKKPILA